MKDENVKMNDNDKLRKTKIYRDFMIEDLFILKSNIHYIENNMDLSEEKTKTELNILKLVLSDKIRLISKYGENKKELHRNSSIKDVIEYTKQFNMKEQEDEELRLTEQYRYYIERYNVEQLLSSIESHIDATEYGFMPNGLAGKEMKMNLRIMKLALSDKEKEKMRKTK